MGVAVFLFFLLFQALNSIHPAVVNALGGAATLAIWWAALVLFVVTAVLTYIRLYQLARRSFDRRLAAFEERFPDDVRAWGGAKNLKDLTALNEIILTLSKDAPGAAEELTTARLHRERMETLESVEARLSGVTRVQCYLGSAVLSLVMFGGLALIVMVGVPSAFPDAAKADGRLWSVIGWVLVIGGLIAWMGLGYLLDRGWKRWLEKRLAELEAKHPGHVRRWGGMENLKDLATVKEIIKMEKMNAPPL